MGGLALWVILKGMTAKPNKESWPTAIAGLLIGTWLIYGNIPVESTIDVAFVGAGVYAIIVGVLEIGCLTFAREKKIPAIEDEEERPSSCRSSRSHTPAVPEVLPAPVATPTESPNAPAEPVSAVAAPSVSAPTITPATDEEEERDENENSSPTPPAAKPLAGKRVCVTGKLPYKRKAITDFIVAMGGEVKNRPTRNTDYLVAGEDCGTKLDEAEKYGVAVIDYADLLALCGLPVDADIYEVMPREFREERMRGRLSSEEAREYGREFKRRLHLLQEILTSTVSDLLPKSVQVVTRVDDELELHRVSGFRSTPRGELVLLSTEGESIYLNDLTGDSVVRLLGLYRR